MKIEWEKISPEEFEKICFKLIEENDFKNLSWFGKSGGDKGRDLICFKNEEPLSGIIKNNKWVIQCKRYILKPPTKAEINNILVNAEEHNPNDILIVVTNTLSANTKDWIEEKRKKAKYFIHIWEELDLEREIDKHRRKLERQFPDIIVPQKEVILYEVKDYPKHYFGCDEFEEIDIRVINSGSPEVALKRVKEYIEYLKNNNIVWEEKPNTNS